MRGLFNLLLELPIAPPYTKASQPFDIFRRVKAVSAGGAPGKW